MNNKTPIFKRTKTIIALALILALAILSTFVIAEEPFVFKENVDTIKSMMDIIQEDYYKDVDEQKLIKGAIKGMFEALDPHSVYFDKEEFKAFQTSTSGEFGGIGAQVERKNNRITVVSPIEGTPAYKAGLKTGDVIATVDDTDVGDYELDKAVALIRGEAGTKVKLGVIKAGKGNITYIELTRDIIKLESVKTVSPYNQGIDKFTTDKRIGYVRITEFSENTYSDFKELIDKYKKEGKKGLIIDLRYNPGGLLDIVVKMCQEIIPEGPIVHIDYKGDANDEVFSSKLKNPPFKIVVMVNEGSASASEILTGAVKDSNAGKIVGTKTYGKGTVQHVSYLLTGGGIKLTVAEYLTRNKVHIDGKGIQPDVEAKPIDISDLAPVKADRTLTKGIVGLDVYGIQQRLGNLGYKVKADGILSTGTIDAAGKLIGKKLTTIDKSAQKAILEKYNEKAATSIVDVELKTAVETMAKLLK